MRMSIVASILSLLAMAAATLVATPATAAAATNVGQFPGVEPRCADSPHSLCLYYGDPSTSAWWGTGRTVGDLGDPPQYFTGPGEGAGRPVKGNAASMSCDMTTTSICYVFNRAGHTGDVDYSYGQRTGYLKAAHKNNVSVKLSLGV